MPKAVFLDRDGTVIADRGYLSDPGGVEILPGAVEALRSFLAAGYLLLFVSNQSGIGRGLMTPEQSDAVHRRTLDLLAEGGIAIAASLICPHAPWDHCQCRKPLTTLVDRAAAELHIDFSRSIVIGDKKTDVDLGRAIGARAILYAAQDTRDNAGASPDFRSGDWREIAAWVALNAVP